MQSVESFHVFFIRYNFTINIVESLLLGILNKQQQQQHSFSHTHISTFIYKGYQDIILKIIPLTCFGQQKFLYWVFNKFIKLRISALTIVPHEADLIRDQAELIIFWQFCSRNPTACIVQIPITDRKKSETGRRWEGNNYGNNQSLTLLWLNLHIKILKEKKFY